MSLSAEKTLGVVVPVYNTEDDYLLRSLSSLDQDCKDYCVVIVDDGSQDHTSSLCKHFVSERRDKFFYIRQENGGQNSARNVGIRALGTPYVMFVDSDDILADGALEFIVKLITENNPDLLIFDTVLVDSRSNGSGPFVPSGKVVLDKPAKRALLAEQCSLWGLVYASPQSFAIPLAEGFHMGEDFASVLPIIALSNNIVKVSAPLYGYVQRPTSATKSRDYKYPLEILKAFDHLSSFPLLESWHEEIEWQAIKQLLFFEPLKLIDSGLDSNANKAALASYMLRHFPRWRENPYLALRSKDWGPFFLPTINGHWWLYGLWSKLRPLFHRKGCN